jgi:hypothetical protein
MNARSYLLLLLLFSIAIAMWSPDIVSADPCAAQLGFPIIPTVYANSIVTVIVPLSVTCPISYGNQINATANAYDLNTDTSAGSVNTILTSVNGGYIFAGQLGFNLPASTQGHWVQVVVSVYSSQEANQLTSTGEAFQINTGTPEVVTTTLTTTQPTSYQFAPPANQRTTDIFGYVAIAFILATVIIVTVGLVVYSRKQPSAYEVPRRY